MGNRKKLEEKQSKIREELYELEQQEFVEIQIPFLESLVGKHFIYRDNTYGGNVSRWNEYRKVLELFKKEKGTYYLIYEDCSIDGYGNAKIETGSHFPYTNKNWFKKIPFGGYEKITEKQYETNRNKVLKEISNPTLIKRRIVT